MNIEYDEQLLEKFSAELVRERDEAIAARKKAGLDAVWKGAREQYQGIDEVNRARSYEKGETLDGSISTTMGSVDSEKRSTVFVNITRPYTNAGVARVADILLPTSGKRNWDLRLTPVSDIALLRSFVRAQPQLVEAMPEELQARLVQTPEEQEVSISFAKEMIDDWLVESRWHSQIRKQITEAGKVGTGVLKGPFAKKKPLSVEVQATMLAIQMQVEDPAEQQMLTELLRVRLEYQPGVESIPVENLYPDMPSCGDNINNGRFVWEEIPHVNKSTLSDLAKDGEYFPNQMQIVLSEDPLPCKAKGEAADKKKKSYTRWRRPGEIDLAKITGEKDAGTIYAEVELINDRVVKIEEPVLKKRSGFGYHCLLWEPRQDSWAGIGIPEQIETPQRGLNASARAGNDNMGWSVGFQLILGKGLQALNGENDTFEPYKMWQDVTDALEALSGKSRSARDAIATVEFPNHLQRILEWIEFWLRMAESTTGLSLLLQGQKSSDSVGVSQMLMNSNTTNLRMFVKHWDDDVCTPVIQDMYQWVQDYGPEEAKGDAVANPLGSSTLVVRDLQQQMLIQLLDRVVQPVYGKSPQKFIDAILEGSQLDPANFELGEEERARLEAAANEPDPKVQATQLTNETKMVIEQMKDARERLEMMLDYQAKGASLASAQEIVDTQVSGSIVQEDQRQEGKIVQEQQKAQMATPKEDGSNPTNKVAEPSIDEALSMLGLDE